MRSSGMPVLGGEQMSLPAPINRDLSRNVGLDACRALTIVLVVFGHGVGYLEPLFPNVVQTLQFSGFIGVELFFVLSGFLVGQILIRQAEGGVSSWLGTFYLRRMFRTLPSYALFLGLNVLFALVAMRPAVPDDWWKYLIFIQNLATPHPSFFPEAWSLAIEELFYIGFPLCFLAVSWALGISRRTAMLVTSLTVIVVSLVARGIVAPDSTSWDAGVRKIASLHFDGLMVGVLLGWLHQARSRILNGKALARTLVAVLMLCAIYLSMTPLATMNVSYFAKTFLFTVTSIGCAGLLVGSIDLCLPPGFRRVVTLIARSSYSAYLVNLPVLILMNQFAWNDRALGAGLFLLFNLTTFSLSFILYWNVEVPFYRYRDRYVQETGRPDNPHLRLVA